MQFHVKEKTWSSSVGGLIIYHNKVFHAYECNTILVLHHSCKLLNFHASQDTQKNAYTDDFSNIHVYQFKISFGVLHFIKKNVPLTLGKTRLKSNMNNKNVHKTNVQNLLLLRMVLCPRCLLACLRHPPFPQLEFTQL